MTIRGMEGRYAILKYDAAMSGPPPGLDFSRGSGLVSLTRTEDEISLVCREEGLATLEGWSSVESGWRLFMVEGPLDFGLTGILSSIATPLAEAGISLFAISTWDTDYILVKSGSFDRAAACLAAAGFAMR